MGLRQAYQDKAFAQLCEWQAWIEQIKNSSTNPQDNGPADKHRVVAHLEDCHRIAHIHLEELRLAKDERWELVKQAVERAMIDLKQALDTYGMGRSGRIIRLQDSRDMTFYSFDRKG